MGTYAVQILATLVALGSLLPAVAGILPTDSEQITGSAQGWGIFLCSSYSRRFSWRFPMEDRRLVTKAGW